MNSDQLKNKVLQALYKPGKGNVSTSLTKTMKDMESYLDKNLGKSKSDDKEDKKDDEEKKDD